MKRLSLVVCLAVVGSLLGGLVHGYGQGVVDHEVIETLEKTGEARVIIALKDPVPVTAPLGLRRQKIAEVQAQVLSAVSPADFKTTFQYKVDVLFAVVVQCLEPSQLGFMQYRR